jgi:hypothetical protein
MRMLVARGFVLDRLQVAGERDGFDGGRLVYAMLDLLCYHSSAPAKSERERLALSESLLNQSCTLFTLNSQTMYWHNCL